MNIILHPESERFDYEPANLQPRPIRWPFVVMAVGLVLFGFFAGRATAAELPTERPWVVWLVDENRPWTSPKGYQATATVEEACRFAMHEVTGATAKGTRLACRRIGGK